MPVPVKLLKAIITNQNVKIYFETGLSEGNGVRKALSCGFEKIYSIDLCSRWIKEAKENFKDNDNVILIEDDSQNLAEYIKDIKEKTLFFLDAHNDHSNMHYEQSDIDCPVIKELEAIKISSIKNHVIIIDDVRIFKNKLDESLIAFGGEFKGQYCQNWGKHIDLKEIEMKILEINPLYKIKYKGDQIIAQII